MSRRLIVNADDFGIGRCISEAIVESHRLGIVTSTTLMVNMPAAAYAGDLARDVPTLGVGVHLTLTAGCPVTRADRIPALVDDRGRFHGFGVQARRLIWDWRLLPQVEAEFCSQIERALDLGIRPTHCDSHHGVTKFPVVRSALIRAMGKYGIVKARAATRYYWVADGATRSTRVHCFAKNLPRLPWQLVLGSNRRALARYGVSTPHHLVNPDLRLPSEADPKARFLAALAALPDGDAEITLHPGRPDADVADPPGYGAKRARDYALAVDSDCRRLLEQMGVRLISFREL